MQIGQYYELEVGKEVPFGLYLNSDLGEILLPTKYIPDGTKVGDKLKVFLYKDSEDRLIATTLEPYGILNDFVALEVKDITNHGAFLDWGLEKDLFVPKKEQHGIYEVGKKYIVKICLDHKTDRLIGVGKLSSFFNSDTSALSEGQEVDLLIYHKTDKGYMAIVDQLYHGLIYYNEVFGELNIGDAKKGFIKKIREDGKLDLSINKQGIEAIDDNRQVIINKLTENGGFLPFHDKSEADEISKTFSMSKKAFKKAIGGLYKDKLIDIKPNGIEKL